MAEKTYRTIEAVRKACEILSVLAEAKEPITGAEVALRMRMSQGTVMCHLATLQDAGLVQEIGGGWRLGLKMAVYWARIRATMEAERDRLTENIKRIGGN